MINVHFTFLGHVNTACWSPDGTTLLFTTSAESQIFCLKFLPNIMGVGNSDLGAKPEEKSNFEEAALQSAGAAVPVMDLTRVSFNCEDGEDIR